MPCASSSLAEPRAHVPVHRLDERGLAHAARAPQQRVVGGQPPGEALGVLGELRRDVLETLEQRQGHAVDLADRLEGVPLRMPHEGFRGLEIGLRGPGRRQPLERCGQSLEARDQGGFVVHPVSR